MKSILITMIAVLAILVGIWYVRDSGSDSETGSQDAQEQDSGSNNGNSRPVPTGYDSILDDLPEDDDVPVVEEEIPNGMSGELQLSNDQNRGNLMLLLDDSDRIIYLFSARDYSDLIGKHVLVTIEGSVDDFRLVDIQEQGN